MKFSPREYQQQAIDWILERQRSALWLDMGLGKTASTLAAFDQLCDMAEVARGLVVAPKRVAEQTWPAECQKWDQFNHLKRYVITAEDLPTKVVNGKRQCRLSKLAKEGLLGDRVLFFVHYDLLPRLVQAFHDTWPWDFVVCDESSMLKSHDTQRFKALKKVSGQIDRMVQLTGTPSPNGIEQLFSQMYLINPELLGRTITEFRTRFMVAGAHKGHVVYEWKPRRGAREEFYGILADVAMSMKSEDWLQLPERISNVIYVDLQEGPRMLYQTLEKDYIATAGENVVEAVTGAALGNKLLQLANGAVYATGDEAGSAIGSSRDAAVVHVHDAKLDALEELAEENETLLVAYAYRHDLDRLRKRFPYAEVMEDNLGVIDRWNKGQIKMLLTHPRSAGHGLNLQDGGSVAVWFGLTYDLEIYQQWNKRLHRSGQTADRVVIHHLVTRGTIDEDVMVALEGKAGKQDALLYAVGQRLQAQKSPH